MTDEELTWPQTAADWRQAIATGIGMPPDEAERLYAAGELPTDRIVAWIEVEYSATRGYHSDFVPALTRNLNGLLRWAYGAGAEPNWSRGDADQPAGQ